MRSDPSHPPDEHGVEPDEDMSAWQREMLYQQRTRTDLANERKYLGWLRASLALVTLGFVVERVDLFLARSRGRSMSELTSELRFAPMVIFGLGALTIGVATWEFFADQRRIDRKQPRGSWLLVTLIIMTLVSVVVIAGLLVIPA